MTSIVLTSKAPLADAARKAASELIGGAAATLRELAAKEVAETKAVHEVRKKIKRTRALLRLLRSSIERAAYEAASDELRAIGHALAPARDAAATRATIADVARRAPAELTAPLARAGDVIRARRDGAGRIDGPRAAALANAVDAAGLTFAGLAPRHVERRIEDALERVASAAKRRLAEVEEWPGSATFHALRRRVKDMLFEMELLEAIRAHRRRSVHRRLDELGDVLGREHDLGELLADLDRASDAVAESDRELLTRWLESMRTDLRRDALERARRLVPHKRRLVRAILGKR